MGQFVDVFSKVKADAKRDLIVSEAKKTVGEPFAGYTDFDDCISQNSDKEDPAAFCAYLKKQTEGQ